MVSCYPIKKAPNQGAWSINGKSLGNDNEHIHPFFLKPNPFIVRGLSLPTDSDYSHLNRIHTMNFEQFLVPYLCIRGPNFGSKNPKTCRIVQRPFRSEISDIQNPVKKYRYINIWFFYSKCYAKNSKNFGIKYAHSFCKYTFYRSYQVLTL